jgi:hypothetical protein
VLISGPHGAFKTFVLMDMMAAAIVERPFLGKKVRRQCGALLFAAEGGSTIQSRLRAIIEHKVKPLLSGSDSDMFTPPGVPDPNRVPFAYIGNCRPLLDPRTVDCGSAVVEGGLVWLRRDAGFEPAAPRPEHSRQATFFSGQSNA